MEKTIPAAARRLTWPRRLPRKGVLRQHRRLTIPAVPQSSSTCGGRPFTLIATAMAGCQRMLAAWWLSGNMGSTISLPSQWEQHRDHPWRAVLRYLRRAEAIAGGRLFGPALPGLRCAAATRAAGCGPP